MGIARNKENTNTESITLTPWKIKKNDAKQVISLINAQLLNHCLRIEEEYYFCGAWKMDDDFNSKIV